MCFGISLAECTPVLPLYISVFLPVGFDLPVGPGIYQLRYLSRAERAQICTVDGSNCTWDRETFGEISGSGNRQPIFHHLIYVVLTIFVAFLKAALWNRNRNRWNRNFLTSGTGTGTGTVGTVTFWLVEPEQLLVKKSEPELDIKLCSWFPSFNIFFIHNLQ